MPRPTPTFSPVTESACNAGSRSFCASSGQVGFATLPGVQHSLAFGSACLPYRSIGMVRAGRSDPAHRVARVGIARGVVA